MKKKKSFVRTQNARTENYRSVLQKIETDGKCPFCMENFLKYHTKPILFKTKHWVITTNAWPYENALHHFLLVSTRHLVDPAKLKSVEWADLQSCIKKIEKRVGLNRGTLLFRYGEPSFSGGTVDHLHPHLVIAKSVDKAVITRI